MHSLLPLSLPLSLSLSLFLFLSLFLSDAHFTSPTGLSWQLTQVDHKACMSLQRPPVLHYIAQLTQGTTC